MHHLFIIYKRNTTAPLLHLKIFIPLPVFLRINHQLFKMHVRITFLSISCQSKIQECEAADLTECLRFSLNISQSIFPLTKQLEIKLHAFTLSITLTLNLIWDLKALSLSLGQFTKPSYICEYLHTSYRLCNVRIYLHFLYKHNSVVAVL